mmetsp:Transcript_10909/g.16482  ORF Transcript_10909/g.16482 Transcript_10909/m.16482 type:complete len:165 (-) Transcript_10909:47-541(-)
MSSSDLRRGSWLGTLRLTSILTTAFIPVHSLFSIIGNFYNVVYVVLQIYVAIVSILCLFAELRFIGIIRRMVFPLIKWFYFITHHEARAIVYFFLSLIMMGRKNIFTLALSVLLFGLAVCWPILNRIYEFDYPVDSKMKEIIAQTCSSQKEAEKTAPIIVSENP